MTGQLKQSQTYDKKPKIVRYQGRFVKESFGDKYEMQPGAKFTKSWVFRNDGETSWPMDVFFIQTSGDDLGAGTSLISE